MARVFVSHASSDRTLVNRFVNTILRLGCGLGHEQIFFSSAGDTGVPSGTDLNAYVRNRAGDDGLVVAILSPAFRASPFCLTELGAAWGRNEDLFPLRLPSMPRSALDGVLAGMVIHPVDDPTALDELRDRVSAVVGTTTPTTTWNEQKTEWLAEVGAARRRARRGARRPSAQRSTQRSCGERRFVLSVFGSHGALLDGWVGEGLLPVVA
ncbi:MAG TPA: toll/interleukin-1 receptor domain-containing protein [Thermoleophilaceae bacterium]|jgi:hypothetical protein